MEKFSQLPMGYAPYSLLSVCGNKLYGGALIMAVGGSFPILIGAGFKPQIWLRAVRFPGSKDLVSLVESSISKNPLVTVEEIGRQIVVKVKGGTVLRVEQTGDSQALVTEMDLRSLGFNVYGGMNSLTVGSNSFSGNSLMGGVLAGFNG
ncbi:MULTISPECIES: hypothetical protein [unclassified Pseudomonas]|uniref:hypothetical protein n=1 Tax=unclassified Pseudomonas TaxID=196821 RepID=UPI001F46E56E|nr:MULTISPECIES: hypothetical protein [unclassified Pseudomonas]MCF5232423.1 hypothetical protein [Pseudomonas sp. PA-5-4H]MCF5236850.1 hypothetical protein [Pseudomonas sp. PA-5-4G]MCF5248702.1 hypothetical protein [Pseudomonas sp. PA-5-4B]MCF5256776.1 hypothetical protein [Pseudomonas sp. PA-5-4B]MCF5263305.1 hypothetical protein [Pseudomonas sp. PA-5-4A]